MNQINELKQEQSRLSHTNASLQQMFNEGKQNLDMMTLKYQQLEKSAEKTKEGKVVVEKESKEDKRVREMEEKLKEERKKAEKLRQ